MIARDQPLLKPDALPSNDSALPQPPLLRDAEGHILNTGTGGGKPSRDLSVNFVPVPYPEYLPSIIPMRPGERQLWRVVNAAAVTYLNLVILQNGLPQPLRLASLDGVPITENGAKLNRILWWQSHLLVPPGSWVDFVYKGPPEGMHASLV